MPETKTNKMMERERTNEEKEKQTNETQLSKSLNLKSKSKLFSFQPINKDKEIALKRQRENEPTGWVGKWWMERDTGEREKVIEEKERCRRESELDYIKLGFPFLPPMKFFFT